MLGIARRNGETTLNRPQATELTRWDPWSEFNRIRSDMDSLVGGMFAPAPTGVPTADAFVPSTFAPQVEIYENTEKFTLNAYLPGLSSEDIHLEVVGKTVHIWGESRSRIPEEDVTVHVAQRRHGQFDLRYTLPIEVNAEATIANYRDGVLEMQLPKAESVKPKAIEVQVQK